MKTTIAGVLLISMIAYSNIGNAQSVYKIQKNETIDMKLNGTSTFHDWEMDAVTATGEAQFTFKSGDESELESLKSLTFNLIVTDLKSDNKGLDKNAYKALKTDEFKTIHYVMSNSNVSPESGGYLLETNGLLTVAGVTKNVDIDIHLVVNNNHTVTCKGAYELKMTDYNVEPPSFMMGLMKTGDATTLDFAVTYIN